MTNFIQRVLTKLDIFGSNVGLNYNKNNVFQTSIGGIMSCSFCVFIGIFFWSSIYDNNPPPITVDASQFMFAVKLDQPNFLQRPYLNLTFEPRVYVNYANGTTVKTKWPMQLEQCTLNHFMKLPNQGTNWTRGNYNSFQFYHWKFSITKCQNTTYHPGSWKPVCASTSDINNYFSTNQGLRFLLYMNNFVINPLQSTDYVSTFVTDQLFFSVVPSVVYTTADIYFTENTINTDQSLIPFADIQTEKILTYRDGNFRQQYVVGPAPTVYAEFYVRKDLMTYVYDRSFMKIGDILSYIGGFTQVFILLCAIIVNYYNDYVYAISLANKIYDFDFGKKELSSSEIDGKNKNKTEGSKRENILEQYQIKEKDGVIEEQIDKESCLSQEVSNNINNPIVMDQENSSRKISIAAADQNSDKHTDKKRKTQIQQSQIAIEIPPFPNYKEQEFEKAKQQRSNDKKLKTQKRVTTREEDGLMNLDKLKQILEERKNKIESTRKIDPQQKGFGQLLLSDLALDKQESEIRKQQCNNQFFENMKKNNNNREQIEQKEDIMNESIEPESPLYNKTKTKKHSDSTKPNQKTKVKAKEDIQRDKEESIDDNGEEEINKGNIREETKQIENQFNVAENIPSGMSSPEFNPINSNQAIFQDVKKIDNITSSEAISPLKSCGSPMSPRSGGLFEGLGFRDKKQFLTKEFEFLLKRQKHIGMTFKYILYKITFGKLFRTEQVLLLDKANEQMKKDLDIFMILNRIKELEKFKALFFDRNQEILFNFFPKPVISIQNTTELLSRAEIIENIRSVQNPQKKDPKHKINPTFMKKMKLNFKTAFLVTRAVQLFKKPLLRKVSEFDSISAYQRLYDAYEALKTSGPDNQLEVKNVKRNNLEFNSNSYQQNNNKFTIETAQSPLKNQAMSSRLKNMQLDSYRMNSCTIRSGDQIGGELLSDNRMQLLSESKEQTPLNSNHILKLKKI